MRHKYETKNNQSGFAIIEVVLAGSILAVLTTVMLGALSYASESTAMGGQRARAAFLAQEGLEAARNLRDHDFSGLADGTYGLAAAGGLWAFSGSEDTTGEFTRHLDITSVDADTKMVVSTVDWVRNEQPAGEVSATTYLTDWRSVLPPPPPPEPPPPPPEP